MTSSICPDCGRPVPPRAPGGLCPACLLGLTKSRPDTTFGSSPSDVEARSAGAQGAEVSACRIGRYKLLEIIGEGGFGTIWMAEQEEPVRRKVALKIIKLGMDTRQVVARFEAERQALALMDHPNIARILDGGATSGIPAHKSETTNQESEIPEGRPYFVLELVRGLPITEYCDARQLSTRELPIQSAAFLPDGKHLVTAGWLGHLLVWDIEANPPRLIQQHREHTTYVPSLAVAPGGGRIVTGSADQSLCLWDASTNGLRSGIWQRIGLSPRGMPAQTQSPPRPFREMAPDSPPVTMPEP